MSRLTAGKVIVYKNRSGQEMGDPRIIPPLRNRPHVGQDICTEFRNSSILLCVYTSITLVVLVRHSSENVYGINILTNIRINKYLIYIYIYNIN